MKNLKFSTIVEVLCIVTICILVSIVKCEEEGCPPLNTTRCIEVTCQNITDNAVVECLKTNTLVPQGTVANYKCLPHAGKNDEGRIYKMLCICHGKWAGIQKFLKFSEWCSSSTDTGPFKEEPEGLMEAGVVTTPESRQILVGETTTIPGLTTLKLLQGVSTLSPSDTSTVPLETTTGATSQTGSTGPSETGTTSQPGSTGPAAAAGSTGTASTQISTVPTSSELGTTLSPLSTGTGPTQASTVPTSLELATTLSPTQTSEHLIENNRTREPKSDSLFRDSSNTTETPSSGEGGSTSTGTSGTSEVKASEVPKTIPTTVKSEEVSTTQASTGTPATTVSSTGQAGTGASTGLTATTPSSTGQTATTASTGLTATTPGSTGQAATGASTPLQEAAATNLPATSETGSSTPGSIETTVPSTLRSVESTTTSQYQSTITPAVTTTIASITTTVPSLTTIVSSETVAPTPITGSQPESLLNPETANGTNATSVEVTTPATAAIQGEGRSNLPIPPGCPNETVESFKDYELFALEAHNSYRRNHSVPELKLNQTVSQIQGNGKLLNEKAQSWAEHELNEKTLQVTPGTRSYAENLYKVSGWKALTSIRAVSEAMKTWYSSIDKYNWTNPNPTGFSQIVWKKTTDIGVGVAKKDDVTVVAVTYWPRGNIILIGSKDSNVTVDPGKLFKENVFPKISG